LRASSLVAAPVLGAVAFFLALMACGGGSASLAAEDVDVAARTAGCTRGVRCGLIASVVACEAVLVTPPPPSYAAARDAGHLDYDGEAAQRCADALAALPCDQTSRAARSVAAACRDRFRGKIADGAACAFDEECASARCDQGACPEGVCCAGTCGPTRSGGAPGDACDRSSECGDGFCDADHTCHTLVAAGGDCMRDEQCGYGLACTSPSPSLPGTCRALPHAREACPYGRCADLGMRCDATSHCAPLGQIGEPCMAQVECSPYLECNTATHACASVPVLGMACDVKCAGDSFCNPDVAGGLTCTPLMANGTMCDDPGTCASHNCKPGPVFPSCQDYPICP
jgi:hypothetical protein